MVTHVPVIGILMIINGVLASLLGLMLAFAGPFLLKFVQQGGQQGIRPGDEQVLTVVSIIYLVSGVFILISGIFNVIAGIRVLRYRGRTFAIVALFANILPLFTCYCSPTSLGLIIYGLIVMFQSDVVRAFALSEEGFTPEEIKRRFAFPQESRRDRDDDYYQDRDESDRPSRPRPRNDDFPPDDGRYK